MRWQGDLRRRYVNREIKKAYVRLEGEISYAHADELPPIPRESGDHVVRTSVCVFGNLAVQRMENGEIPKEKALF